MSTYTPAKRRTIRKVLQAKIRDWLDSLPLDLQNDVKDKVVVTGGSIVSLLTGEPINDFDIYFKDLETTEKVAKYYAELSGNQFEVKILNEQNILGEDEVRVINHVPSTGVIDKEGDVSTDERLKDAGVINFKRGQPSEDEERETYQIQFVSRNAITLTDKVQIITRFYGDPDVIHRSFDFQHCMGYFETGKHELVLPAEMLEAILSRTLIYKGSLYPLASIFRMKKFVERGWRIGAGEMLKIMWQISELDLRNVALLMDQLTGADLLYFHALISALSQHEIEEVSTSTVMELIDKIFND